MNTLLTIYDVSKILNIKLSRLRTAVFKREIPVIRIGRLLRFDQDDLYKWVESQKDQPYFIK